MHFVQQYTEGVRLQREALRAMHDWEMERVKRGEVEVIKLPSNAPVKRKAVAVRPTARKRSGWIDDLVGD